MLDCSDEANNGNHGKQRAPLWRSIQKDGASRPDGGWILTVAHPLDKVLEGFGELARLKERAGLEPGA